MAQKKVVKLRHKKTGQVVYMRKSGKPGSSTMPKLKLKKYNKVTRKREVFEESKKQSYVKKQKPVLIYVQVFVLHKDQ